MRKINYKLLVVIGFIASTTVGCLKDMDFENGKFQSVDNHGHDQNMISTAVTTSSSDQFLAQAVDASSTATAVNLIPVVVTSAQPASHDIHVTMEPAPEVLATFNSNTFDEFDPQTGKVTVAHPELYYVMPGSSGTPAFTLVDDGVVTIKAGQTVGYLQIQTATADYFGETQYAYSYKISSVQEGNPVSGNNNFGIVAIIPKNKYDGKYNCSIQTFGWAAYGIADGLKGDVAADYGVIELGTASLTSNTMINKVAGGNLEPAFTAGNATKTAFGAATPVYVFDSNGVVTDVYNSTPDDGRGRKFSLNPAAATDENKYFPAQGATAAYIKLNYLMYQNGRPNQTIKMTLTYAGAR
jgi:hypothetical protein